jgi:hypothetical protein
MTAILTGLAALREHPRTSELREHIRRGYGYRAVGGERVWSLHDDEIQVLNTGFTCLDDHCKSLIALVQEAAGEIERLQKLAAESRDALDAAYPASAGIRVRSPRSMCRAE